MATPESEAIPYQAQDLRGERLLVLAPHPDDEVIGCGGVVAQHARDGRQIDVLVGTDGAAGGDAATRERESARALKVLGVTKQIRFLRFADRDLGNHINALRDQIAQTLWETKPDLILAPSPIEIHPDHLALARAFCEVIQIDPSLFADLATARIAFYEVGQPLRPNALVDISDVADLKYAAIAEHTSQLAARDYVSYTRGLNAYRAMTIDGATFVEAYWTIALPQLRTTPFSQLRASMGDAPRIEVMSETIPISVVVRTKDRPDTLRDALDSIRATRYPAEIVVVNDGGAKPDVGDAKLIEHETSRGRSEAANAGVRAASNPFISFLDDDDIVYPEHYDVLASASRAAQHEAWYSDAVSSFNRGSRVEKTLRIYSRDFDRDLLLVENYIPLPTLLMRRESFLDAGGFDSVFDLFEDWEFLVRLAQRGTFLHVARVTCEIRHIEGSGSIVMAAPAGSDRFRAAKLQVWKKHADRMTDDLFASAIELQKRELLVRESESVEARGARHLMEIDRARLEREKSALIGEVESLHARIGELSLHNAQIHGVNGELRDALGAVNAERNELLVRVTESDSSRGALTMQLTDVRGALDEAQRTIAALYTEIGRLQTLLDSIYGSRTWKLHSIVEKMKGRG